MMSNQPRRCWINQPSKFQLLHEYHGTNVLAVPYSQDSSAVYFLEGEVVSMVVSNEALDNGWRQNQKPEVPRDFEEPHMYVTFVEGRRTTSGSRCHCTEWADAWNFSDPEHKAVVRPLYLHTNLRCVGAVEPMPGTPAFTMLVMDRNRVPPQTKLYMKHEV